jgi:hypothetical protein
LEVANNTPYVLYARSAYHSSGRWETAPDGLVPSNTVSLFSAEDKDASIATGAIGTILYQFTKPKDGDPQDPSRTDPHSLVPVPIPGHPYGGVALYYANPSAGGYKANAVITGLDDNSADHWNEMAEFWYDHLSTSANDASQHYFPYTEDTSSRSGYGFSLSFSAGEQAGYTVSGKAG